jgi:hypothetical protein
MVTPESDDASLRRVTTPALRRLKTHDISSPTQEVVMTSTTQSTQNTTVPIAAATVVGTTAFNALGVFGDPHANGQGVPEFLTIVAVTLVAAAVVFGVVIPRVTRPAGVGLGLSIAGLVLVLAFWSGLTPPLAVGGILLGAAARRANVKAALGSAAVAVGSLALVGYTAIYVLDWMSSNNIAGM